MRVGKVTVRTGVPLISMTIVATVVSRTENWARVEVDDEDCVPNTGSHGGGLVPPQPSGPQVLLLGTQHV